MTLAKIYATREEWLTAAVEEFRAVFAAQAVPIPAKVRVSCGFPSTAKRSGAIGECWADTASADKSMEIMVSPVLSDTYRVIDVLVHELCHTTAGAMNHGLSFQKVADAMHLVPSATKGYKATSGGDAFKQAFGPIIDGLGEYPHAQLSMSTRKVQATRMLKAVCPSCGYTIRLTHKWAAQGLPTCHKDGATFTLGA
jgi:ribosomal protein L37E